MSNQVLYFKDKLEPYTNEDEILFQPVEHEGGYIVATGWEEYVKSQGVEFDTITLNDESKPNV